MNTDMERWELRTAAALIALSVVTYLVHFLIFRDAHHIEIFFLGDLGFVFLEVILVTMVIHGLLERREKRTMLSKLNMVIGAFFSEVGKELLRLLVRMDQTPDRDPVLVAKEGWTGRDFDQAVRRANEMTFDLVEDPENLNRLKAFGKGRRDFLLRLLENPNLLEHDRFTDLLFALFHLMEELEARDCLHALPEEDLEHLSNDSRRVYDLLIVEWLEYMRHLSRNYPYLYSLARRTNPLDPEVCATVCG